MPTPYCTPSLFSVVIFTTFFGFGAAEVVGAAVELLGEVDFGADADALLATWPEPPELLPQALSSRPPTRAMPATASRDADRERGAEFTGERFSTGPTVLEVAGRPQFRVFISQVRNLALRRRRAAAG
jgi:hypothetical protein